MRVPRRQPAPPCSSSTPTRRSRPVRARRSSAHCGTRVGGAFSLGFDSRPTISARSPLRSSPLPPRRLRRPGDLRPTATRGSGSAATPPPDHGGLRPRAAPARIGRFAVVPERVTTPPAPACPRRGTHLCHGRVDQAPLPPRRLAHPPGPGVPSARLIGACNEPQHVGCCALTASEGALDRAAPVG